MPLMGLEAAEGVVTGEDLKNFEASKFGGSLYSVWLDHSTFFLDRLEVEPELVAPVDVGVLAPGGV